MELIDRYVHEVGQRLPSGLRQDVEAELRSLLTESLEERERNAGRTADREMVAEVLRGFGAPKEVASRYAPAPQYLIGPGLYPVFRIVARIMIPVYAAVVIVLLALGYYQPKGEPPSLAALIRATGSFMSGTLYNLGLMGLVFFLVERAMERRENGGKTWDPARLPPVNDPDRISYFGRIFLLYLVAAVALLFNFFPEWVAVVVFHNTEVQVYPLLEPAFRQYLPFLNMSWALSFSLNLVVLRQGRWRRATRWSEFGLELLNAAILAAIILGPPVFTYDWLVKLVLQVFLVIALIRAAGQLYQLLRSRPADPWNAEGVK